MMTDGEEMVNIPMTPETKAALKDRARANGRAARREAAEIIRRAVLPEPEPPPCGKRGAA